MPYTEVLKHGPLTLEEIEAGVGLVTMNRPETLNAINFAVVEAFESLFRALEDNESIRVVILTGAGRGFCAGADLIQVAENSNNDSFRSSENHLRLVQKRHSNLCSGLRRMPQPVIAAVNGVAAGGGFALALASDVRIAASEAFFVASFINIGLSGGEMGSSYFLPRMVGMTRASEILLTGRRVPAHEAERIGLVNRVVPQEELISEALSTARAMLEKSPGGLRLTKRVLDYNATAVSFEAALELEDRNQTIMVTSHDFLKRVSEFTT
ncbi:MAG: enoyl-CoA hydratase/isomerase family protein [Desulfomonilaceae bacterium]|nr:enoyl-CoA hydratase/isomerase family protein [Desulfomonilaceae bacterium]